MRTLLVITLLLATTALASPKPRMTPEILMYCSTPETWAMVAKCVHDHVKGATILPQPSSKSQLVRVNQYASYLFVQFPDTRWRFAEEVDSDYAVVQQRDVTLAKQPAVRIDLRHRIDLGGNGIQAVLTEKIAVICGPSICQRIVFACTVMSRGRATETFLGDVVLDDDGGFHVEGDQSQSGPNCTNR